MAEIYSDDFPMDETICRDCAFKMSRIIKPVDPEDFGISEEELAEVLGDDDVLLVERHTCLIDQTDMDYLVRDCSHFKNISAGAFFVNNIYE